MADGNPRDYSIIYSEDSSSQGSLNITAKLPPIPSLRAQRATPYKQLDGSFVAPKHRESVNKPTVDLRQVVAKLQNLPKDHSTYALETLNKHYSTVFVERRKTSFKTYIHYFDEKDTYVVRINHNSLKAVKEKMPKRGNYRYFFKGSENTCEEVEFDESVVPFLEKDGLRQIYCQVFQS